MKKKIDELTAFFDAGIACCAKREKELIADERKDEANFEKIRANVYNIFHTILGVAVKTCGEDAGAVRSFFLKQLDQIPASWSAAYEAAKQHGDDEKLQIEEIKLAVVREIRTEFSKIWEENP